MKITARGSLEQSVLNQLLYLGFVRYVGNVDECEIRFASMGL
jgi:hypothetical protein